MENGKFPVSSDWEVSGLKMENTRIENGKYQYMATERTRILFGYSIIFHMGYTPDFRPGGLCIYYTVHICTIITSLILHTTYTSMHPNTHTAHNLTTT